VRFLALSLCLVLSGGGDSIAQIITSSQNTDFDDVVKQMKSGIPTDYPTFISEMDRITKSDPRNSQHADASTNFAFSRSLQADKTSLNTPRKVSVFPTNDNHPPTFLGHAEKSGDVEVMSWNPRGERYEFKLIEGYTPQGKPILKLADRKLCVQCHQNEGPIFPHFPWSETDRNMKISDYFAKKGLADNYPQLLNSNAAIVVDNAVRAANRFLAEQKICKTLCSANDLECRKRILIGSLVASSELNKYKKEYHINFLTSAQYANVSFQNDPEMVGVIKTAMKGRTFGQVSSVIPDRVVNIEDPTKSITTISTLNNTAFARMALGKINDYYSIFELGDEPKGLLLTGTLENLKSTGGRVNYVDNTSSLSLEQDNSLTTEKYVGVNPAEPSSPLYKRPVIGEYTPENLSESLPAIASKCVLVSNALKDSVAGLSGEQIKRVILDSPIVNAYLADAPGSAFSLANLIKQKYKNSSKKYDYVNGNRNDGDDTDLARWGLHNPEDGKPYSALDDETQKNDSIACVQSPNPELNKLSLLADETRQKMNLEKGSLQYLQKKLVVGYFKKYCSECHASDKLDLGVKWTELGKLKNYKSTSGSSLIDRLQNLEMPPPGAAIKLEKDRNVMIDALKAAFDGEVLGDD
jgi:hypothetical protein